MASPMIERLKRARRAFLAPPQIPEEEVCQQAAAAYGFPNGFPDVDLLDLFPGFCETITPLSFLSDGSYLQDMALLKMLARRIPDCRFLEIGSWRGESLVNVADVAKECISLTLGAEHLRALGVEEAFINQQGFFMHGYDNIQQILADSRTFDFSTLGAFDLIFVDGDHTREAIASDTRNVFKLLRNEQSVIVWHDYGRTPERIWWPTIAGILDGCPQQYRRQLYHASNTYCAMFTRETVKSEYRPLPAVPNKVFEVTLKARPL